MSGLNFSSYIRELDSKTVLEHLLNGKSEGVLGEAVYSEIELEYISEESVTARWNSLTDSLKQQVLRVYLSGSAGYSSSRLDSPEDRKELLKSFLVFEGRKNGESVLLGFSDLYFCLNSSFSSILNDSTAYMPLPKSAGVIIDSATLLSMIREKRVKRRLDGELQKGVVEQFQRSSVLQISGVSGTIAVTTRFLELLLFTLYKMNIIRYTSSGYVLTDNAETYWAEQKEELSNKVMENSARTGQFCNRSFIESLFQSNFTVTASTAEYWGIVDDLTFYTWCGVIAGGAGKWTLGEASSHPCAQAGHIMPDFTVMIPREIDPVELLKFYQIGEIVAVDVIFKGQISRSSVDSSLACGVSGTEILDLFRKWNSSPHLIRTVEEWIFSFERVFVDGQYLAINHKVSEHISQQEEIAPHITEIPDYKFYRIAPGYEAEIKSKLEKMQFDTRFPQKSNSELSEDNRSPLGVVGVPSPDFAPDLSRSEPVQTNFGMYGGDLRSHTLGELLKVVKYAIFMEEKLAVLSVGETEPVIITPIDVRTGENGTLSGRDSSGESVNFILSEIDKLGVVSDC